MSIIIDIQKVISLPWRFKVFDKTAISSLLDESKSLYVKNVSAQKFNNTKVERFEKYKSSVSHIVAIVVKISGRLPRRYPKVK